MAEYQWFYSKDDKQLGPVSTAQLRQLASRGDLTTQDLVWREGLDDWSPAGRIKGLFGDSGVGQSGLQSAIQAGPSTSLSQIGRRRKMAARRQALWVVRLVGWAAAILVVMAGGVAFAVAWGDAQESASAATAVCLFYLVLFVAAFISAQAVDRITRLLDEMNTWDE